LDKLSNDQMKKIAGIYMKEIGFEKQPYLVYRHNDAGHPHCHIVSTHVRRDGSPIELYNIGRNQSEKARQKIEAEFGLVTTEMKKQLRQQKQQLNGVLPIQYGKHPITPAMSRILEQAMTRFKCASFQDFNDLLSLYNMAAYRGREDSQLYKNGGILYRALDEHGRYIGRPLKASYFDCQPTLARLEQQFAHNQSLKQKWHARIKLRVENTLFFYPDDLHSVIVDLKTDKNIHLTLYSDKSGNVTNVTFLDFDSGCIYRNSELGEKCNNAAFQKLKEMQLIAKERLRQQEIQQQSQQQTHRLRYRHSF